MTTRSVVHTVDIVDVLEIRMNDDGTGAASLTWKEVAAVVRSAARSAIEGRIGSDTEVIEVRFLDADGRELPTPMATVAVVVAFRLITT